MRCYRKNHWSIRFWSAGLYGSSFLSFRSTCNLHQINTMRCNEFLCYLSWSLDFLACWKMLHYFKITIGVRFHFDTREKFLSPLLYSSLALSQILNVFQQHTFQVLHLASLRGLLNFVQFVISKCNGNVLWAKLLCSCFQMQVNFIDLLLLFLCDFI